MLGFGILIPVIPLLLADPTSSYYLLPKSFNIAEGYILLGLLTAIFPLGQFFSTSILGEFSDKFGRKKVLLFCLSVRFFAYLIFTLGIITKNIPLLFLSRIIDGAASGNVAVAQAAIADVTAPLNRAKNFGLMGAAFGLGFIIGPFLGGKLSDPNILSWFSAVTPFLFAAGLVLANIISVIFFFPETLKELKHHIKINWSKSVNNIFHAYSMEKLRVVFLTSFLFWSGFSFFITFFSIFLIKKFGFDNKSADWHIQGEILGVNSSVQALAQSIPPILSGLIAAEFSPDTPLLVAVLVMISASLIFLIFYKPVTHVLYQDSA